MNNLQDRLLQFISHLEISKSEFERTVGLSNGFVDKTGDNTRKTSLDLISKIYPGLNIQWLRTGEGEMLNRNIENLQYKMLNNDNIEIISIPSKVLNELYKAIEQREKTIDFLQKTVDKQISIINELTSKKSGRM